MLFIGAAGRHREVALRKNDALQTMSADELWSLCEQVDSYWPRKITEEKATLLECLRRLEYADGAVGANESETSPQSDAPCLSRGRSEISEPEKSIRENGPVVESNRIGSEPAQGGQRSTILSIGPQSRGIAKLDSITDLLSERLRALSVLKRFCWRARYAIEIL